MSFLGLAEGRSRLTLVAVHDFECFANMYLETSNFSSPMGDGKLFRKCSFEEHF